MYYGAIFHRLTELLRWLTKLVEASPGTDCVRVVRVNDDLDALGKVQRYYYY